MINSSWQAYIMLAVAIASVILLLLTLKHLLKIKEQDSSESGSFEAKLLWLFSLIALLIITNLGFAYYILKSEFQSIQVIASAALIISAVYIYSITTLSRNLSRDVFKSAAIEHYYATHDDLTGLPNLAYFNDQLELILNDAAENEYEVALMLIDLNRFKLINETIGYFAGDLILQEIAQRIRESLRKTDLIARLGGDEFAVLINPVVAQGHIHTISKNIAESIQEPLAVEDKPTDVGVSIGVSVFPNHADDGMELIEKARISMLEAEKRGESVLIYDPDTTLGTAEDIQIIGMLQRAIQEEQLTILYQPQIQLRDMNLASVEALIRWQHPLYGKLDPRHFIPYAERAGLIYEINLWLLQSVVRQIIAWQEKNISLPIAINVTANRFLNKEFQQELNTLMKNNSWLAKFIKIELTETSTIDDASEVITAIKKFKNYGFAFSLDDYGTKRASLEYLKKLPLDELKIDQSFMLNATTDENSKAIISHAKEISQQLGLVTTAEGIENQEALALAQEYKLDYGQGYYFSQAMTPDELVDHINQYGFDAGGFTTEFEKDN